MVSDAAQRDHRSRLLEWLRAFAAGSLTFSELHDRFYYHFVDDLRDDSLSEEDWAFFGRIHERMDLVAPDPDPASRRDGWISIPEFQVWLQEQLQGLPGQ